eukprot:jgi/Botrbrau1/10537/Bobra.7_1s0016.2
MFERLGRSNPFASTQPFRDEFAEHEQDTANARVSPLSSNAWGPAVCSSAAFFAWHAQRKNWPRFKPILRHSISEDVPAERRGMVWRNYWAWVLGAFGFCWNWLIVTIMFIASRKSLPNWLFASLISGFGLPGSFIFWHRNLYKATMTDGTLRWMLFIIFSFAQIGTAGWTFVAPPIVGGWAVGLLTMIDQFKDGGGRSPLFQAFICVVLKIPLVPRVSKL